MGLRKNLKKTSFDLCNDKFQVKIVIIAVEVKRDIAKI